jgi:hypothetical protein
MNPYQAALHLYPQIEALVAKIRAGELVIYLDGAGRKIVMPPNGLQPNGWTVAYLAGAPVADAQPYIEELEHYMTEIMAVFN